jgi:hypothetical protein
MSLRRASAVTGRLKSSFDTRRLEWLTLFLVRFCLSF